MFSDGVFSIEINRDDIDNVTLHGVPNKLSFEINGTSYVQELERNTVIVNSDVALKGEEIDRSSINFSRMIYASRLSISTCMISIPSSGTFTSAK